MALTVALKALHRRLSYTRQELLVMYVTVCVGSAMAEQGFMQLLLPLMEPAYWYASSEKDWAEPILPTCPIGWWRRTRACSPTTIKAIPRSTPLSIFDFTEKPRNAIGWLPISFCPFAIGRASARRGRFASRLFVHNRSARGYEQGGDELLGSVEEEIVEVRARQGRNDEACQRQAGGRGVSEAVVESSSFPKPVFAMYVVTRRRTICAPLCSLGR